LKVRIDHQGIQEIQQKLHDWVNKAALDGHPLAKAIQRDNDISEILSNHLQARRTVTGTTKQFFELSRDRRQSTIGRLNTLLTYEITHVYERVMLIKSVVTILAKHDPKRNLCDSYIEDILSHCRKAFKEDCCNSDFYVTHLLNALCQLYVLAKTEHLASIKTFIDKLLTQVKQRQSMTCYSWILIFSSLVRSSMLVSNLDVVNKGIDFVSQMVDQMSSSNAADLIYQLAICHFAIGDKKQLINDNLILQLANKVNLNDMETNVIHSLMLALHYFYNHNPTLFSTPAYTSLMKQCASKLTNWQSEPSKSQAQDEITDLLKEKLGDKAVEAEVLFQGLPVDIYLPDSHVVIQVQGPTHYIRSSDERTLKDAWHEKLIKSNTDWQLNPVKPPRVIAVSGWDVWASTATKRDCIDQLLSQVGVTSTSLATSTSNLWQQPTTGSKVPASGMVKKHYFGG